MKRGGLLVIAVSILGLGALVPLAQAVNGEPSGVPSTLNLITLMRRGGVVMYPILFCSIIGLSIVLERIWALRRSKVIPERFLREISQMTSPGYAAGPCSAIVQRPSVAPTTFC